MKLKIKRLVFSVLFLLTLSPFIQNCSSVPKGEFESTDSVPLESILLPKTFQWENLTEDSSVQTTTFKIKQYNVTWTCIKIDLSNEKLCFVMEPSETQEIYNLYSVKEFAKKNKTIAAINTTPFDNVDNTFKPWGIVINEGNLISQPVKRTDYAALCIYKNGETYFAQIKSPQSEVLEDKIDYDYVIGGFFQNLQNGEIQTFESIRRSRSGCGISSDGKQLFLFAATPDFSLTDNNGLTYMECAVILKSLGCYNALQFDGGHSTGLCINSKESQKPLFQRKIPCIFGIKENEF